MTNVRREKHSGDICAMRAEFGHRDQTSDIPDGDETPYIDRSMYAVTNGSAEQRAVRRDRDGRYALVLLWHQLMTAFVFPKIPNANVPASITRNELTLIGMDYDIVDRDSVRIVALYMTASRVPDLDGAYS